MQLVQPQYELKHGPGTRPVLAMLNHCTRGTRTVHTVQYYTHSYEYKKRVKCALPVLAIPDHCTRGTSIVHTVQWNNYSTRKYTG